jgi:hypothetical protein
MTDSATSTELGRDKIERMISISRREKLPRLLVALEKLHARLGRGDRVDALAIAKLEEMANEEIKRFEGAPKQLDLTRFSDQQLTHLEELHRIGQGLEPMTEREKELSETEELRREVQRLREEVQRLQEKLAARPAPMSSADITAMSGPNVFGTEEGRMRKTKKLKTRATDREGRGRATGGEARAHGAEAARESGSVAEVRGDQARVA